MYEVLDLPQGSENWHAFRKGKIGCSLAPVVAKVGFETPLEYWKRKLFSEDSRESKGQKQTFIMKRGLDLEPLARQIVGKKLNLVFKPVVIQSVEARWRFASVDGYAISSDNKAIFLEIKCPGEEDHLTALKGQIPKKYYPQLQHIMDVGEVDSMYYYSFDGKEGCLIEVEKDPIYCASLKEQELQFLICLDSGLPPPSCDRDWMPISSDEGEDLVKSLVSINKKMGELEIQKKNIFVSFKLRFVFKNSSRQLKYMASMNKFSENMVRML